MPKSSFKRHYSSSAPPSLALSHVRRTEGAGEALYMRRRQPYLAFSCQKKRKVGRKGIGGQPRTDQLLGHYLAGLIEGDGSIIVPKTVRNQKGKLLYPVVKITILVSQNWMRL